MNQNTTLMNKLMHTVDDHNDDILELIVQCREKTGLTVQEILCSISWNEIDGEFFPCRNCLAYGFCIEISKHWDDPNFPGDGNGLCANHAEDPDYPDNDEVLLIWELKALNLSDTNHDSLKNSV